MKKMVGFYLSHPKLIGAIYCAVPSLGWFAFSLTTHAFREVYLLRLFICLAVGCPIGAYLNKYFLELWLLKHRSPMGPGKLSDGILNGGAIGLGIALLPALTPFISSSDIESAKTFVIAAYLGSAALGALVGGIVTVAGRDYIER
jgi:hypothetical protein